MASLQAFSPAYANGQVLTASAVSLQTAINKSNTSVRIVNAGANIAYVKVGEGTIAATTSDLPLLSGQTIVISKSVGHDQLAYISALGATLHVITGEGGL